MSEMAIFTNSRGSFPEGTEVYFEMENADQWAGDTSGFLVCLAGEWGIRTERSGVVRIGGWLEAYPNSIVPVLPPPHKGPSP